QQSTFNNQLQQIYAKLVPMKTHVRYPFDVKRVKLDRDVEIAYCEEGKGAHTLLFVHGLGNYIPVWENCIRELSNDFRCIAVDLPGNGLSSRGDYPYSMFFYAESIARFCERLSI